MRSHFTANLARFKRKCNIISAQKQETANKTATFWALLSLIQPLKKEKLQTFCAAVVEEKLNSTQFMHLHT